MKIKAPAALVSWSETGEVTARCTALFREGAELPRVWIEIGKRRVECLPRPPEASRHSGKQKIAFTAEFKVGKGMKVLRFCYCYHGGKKQGIGWRFIQVQHRHGHGAHSHAWEQAQQHWLQQDPEARIKALTQSLNEVSGRSQRLATSVRALLTEAGLKDSPQAQETQDALKALLAVMPKDKAVAPQGSTAKGWKVRLESTGWECLKGWVHSAQEPVYAGTYHASFDGAPVTGVITTEDRDDVIAAQAGGEALSFQIPTSSSWFDNQQHKVTLEHSIDGRVKTIATWYLTLQSPWDEASGDANKPVVLFVSHNLRSQGAQNSLFDLVSGLNARGIYRSIVHAPSDGAMKASYESMGLPVVIQPFPNVNAHDSVSRYQDSIQKWANDIARIQPQVIVANTLASFPAILLAKALNLPSLLIPRESEGPDDYFSSLPETLRTLAQSVVSAADRVVFVSNHTREQWERYNTRQHFDTIHNVLRPERLLSGSGAQTQAEARLAMGLRTDDLVFLSLGTVTERKGQLDFLRAFAQTSESTAYAPHRRVIGIIVGMNSSEYSAQLRDEHAALPQSVRDRLLLYPETEITGDSVADYYSTSDVFVLTSRLESYPRVILEAMFFGLAVITTPTFGVLEQCEENGNAFFYEPEDSKALARHFQALGSDANLLARMSTRSRELYAEFETFPQLIDRYEAHINALLKGNGDG